MYDIIVIGAGVTGCAIARALSRYQVRVCVLERASDLCEGSSKANSGIVHAGFDAKPGSLKAKLNVAGARKMPALSRELDFAFVNNEALVLCFEESQMDDLKALYERGIENGVEGLELLDADAVQRIEPALNHVAGALLAKTSGIVCPFELTLAMAENAYENGAEFRFGEEVQQISPISGGYAVTTGNGTYEARIVVNAAGLYADRIHNMVCPDAITITPRRGEYFLLDKDCGNLVQRTIFQLPTKMGKGILVSPTAHGNLLIGPSAENIEDKENTATTSAGLASVRERAALSASDIPYNKVITSFTGLRAVGDTGDFIIGEAAEGFFDAAGIESPGLTSAPAIGEYLCELIGKRIDLTEKPDFKATRKGVTHFAQLSREAQNALIRENPAYGSIVCRCEQITEGEILDAIHRPLGATTLDGVKRRTRAGMGRCQAGFCTPRVMELLAEAQGIPLTDVRKR